MPLFYNDCGVESGAKHQELVRLLRRLIAEGAPITAVGIQGHWSLQTLTPQKLFTIFVKHRAAIDRVTFWGLNDRRSWRWTRYPLVFNAEYQPKPARQASIDVVTCAKA